MQFHKHHIVPKWRCKELGIDPEFEDNYAYQKGLDNLRNIYSKGNKGKTDAKDYYFIDEPEDPETGAIRSKVVYKRSFKKMVADLEAETIDFKKLSEDNPDDIVLYNLSEELKDLFNKFRTHVRKKYKDE